MSNSVQLPKWNDPVANKDIIQFRIGNVVFPRAESGFKQNNKPIYTNINTTQDGRTSQTFVRHQWEISGLSFKALTQAKYAELMRALNLCSDQYGGSFMLTFFNIEARQGEPMYITKEFIVKEFPATVVKVIGDGDPTTGIVNIEKVRIDISGMAFQEV